MTRRIGASVQLDAAKLAELAEVPVEMIRHIEDLSPVMQVIATSDLKPNVLDHLAQGPAWPPKAESTIERDKYRGVTSTKPGIGKSGGFAPSIQRDWSKSNAVAFTRDPGAHLFELGTVEHYGSSGLRVNVFNDKRGGQRHVSRSKSRALVRSQSFSLQHQPARPFMYVDDDVEERAITRVASFVVGDPFDASTG